MTSRRSPSLGLAADFGFAAIHTSLTLWHRLPMLVAALTLQGKKQHETEIYRMANEKTAALVDGLFGAQREMVRLSVATITGRLDFEDMPHVSASVAAAGLRPAFRTVAANSRRLSRRS